MLRVILLAVSQRFIFNKSRFKEAQWSYHLHTFLVVDDLPKIYKRIYKRNNKGPSIVPWGIPQVRVQLLERKPLTAHFCVRLSKYEEGNSQVFPLIPYEFSLDNKIEWLAVSNPFFRSKKPTALT